MNVDLNSSPRWNTESFVDTVHASPLDQSLLGRHFDVCQQLTGRWFVVRRSAEVMHSFVASRFVTTLVVIGVCAGVSALLL